MTTRWRKYAALPVALALVAAACGGDDDSGTGDGGTDTTAAPDTGGDDGDTGGDDGDIAGSSLTITGPERSEEEAGSLQAVLGAWGEENGVEVTYIGDADWEANINTQVQGGNPPDISIFPQPGLLANFARNGDLVPVNDAVQASISANWSDSWAGFGNVDGTQYGVPVKADLKSLVWYKPALFEEMGYEVPTTFDQFVSLMDTMANDGTDTKPLCVGIESGTATGWVFTDWVEDMVLRQHGVEVYDGWVDNSIPFDDPRIVESMQTVIDLWTDDNVYADGGSIAATSFQANGQPLADERCYMHRQASFFASFLPEGSPEGEFDVFYFPDIDGTNPVLVAGTLAAAFNDSPAAMALLEYMATPEYATARQAAQSEALGGGQSGFLSAAIGQDLSVYTPLEQSFIEILENSPIARFDASDLMPGEVGAGSFWTQGTAAVNGDVTVEQAAATIQGSWPS